MTTTLVLGLAVLAVVVTATLLVAPAHAIGEGTVRFAPLPLDVRVVDVVREHGIFADKWTFTVRVTNTGTDTATIDVVDLWNDDVTDLFSDTCLSTSTKIPRGETVRLKPCFVLDTTEVVAALSFSTVPKYDYGFGTTIKQHVVPKP